MVQIFKYSFKEICRLQRARLGCVGYLQAHTNGFLVGSDCAGGDTILHVGWRLVG